MENITTCMLNIIIGGRSKAKAMTEQWLPILGHEGKYEISSFGRVKSLMRAIPCGIRKRIIGEKIMAQSDHWSGYKCVWLRSPGSHKKSFVHRLVAQAFIPNPAGKDIVNHKNENKSDNTVANLEWMNNQENLAYYHANRKKPGQEAKPSSNDDVNQIASAIFAAGF